MINPFKIIKENSRYTLHGSSIVVEHINPWSVKYYDLNEWWKKQPIIPNYKKINLLIFILIANKYKYS